MGETLQRSFAASSITVPLFITTVAHRARALVRDVSSTRVLTHRSASLPVATALRASLRREKAPATLRLASLTAFAVSAPETTGRVELVVGVFGSVVMASLRCSSTRHFPARNALCDRSLGSLWSLRFARVVTDRGSLAAARRALRCGHKGLYARSPEAHNLS